MKRNAGKDDRARPRKKTKTELLTLVEESIKNRRQQGVKYFKLREKEFQLQNKDLEHQK